MFGWLFGKDNKRLEEETKKSFLAVKDDIEKVGNWIKHLDKSDKQLFSALEDIKKELSTISEEVNAMRENMDLPQLMPESKQLLKKMPVFEKQTTVGTAQDSNQTPVQTASFTDFLKSLSSNERLIVFTLLQSEMKLSYEDLALLLGKERSTVRGQINAIKQKSEGLIQEFVEKNGKKRVFIPDEMKEKLSKYAKVRVKGKKNKSENEEKHE